MSLIGLHTLIRVELVDKDSTFDDARMRNVKAAVDKDCAFRCGPQSSTGYSIIGKYID